MHLASESEERVGLGGQKEMEKRTQVEIQTGETKNVSSGENKGLSVEEFGRNDLQTLIFAVYLPERLLKPCSVPLECCHTLPGKPGLCSEPPIHFLMPCNKIWLARRKTLVSSLHTHNFWP